MAGSSVAITPITLAAASAGGEVVMKKTTYELIDISLKMTGSTVTHFSFGVKITHIKSSTKSYAFVLKMALDGDGGTFDEYSSAGALSKKTFHTADRKSTRLNSSHSQQSRMPSSA